MTKRASPAVTELAHTIQNQLGLVTGYAELLKLSSQLSDDQLQSLERIIHAAMATGKAARELAVLADAVSRDR